MSQTWEGLAAGVDCPFDTLTETSDEYKDFVAHLSVSSLYLARNQAYRGTCSLIFSERHVVRLDQLSASEWAALSRDLFVAHAAVVRAVEPDHMNVMLLGNTIPHLHWGLVPRYRNDPRWGAPIFMTSRNEMADRQLPLHEQHALIARLRQELAAVV